MRWLRVLVITLACVVGAALGLTGATLAEPASAESSCTGNDTGSQAGATACAEQLGTASAAEPGSVPRTSTATRHVPAAGELVAPGVPHPATDRAMALLTGWAVLIMVGGGLAAGRGTGRRAEPEP